MNNTTGSIKFVESRSSRSSKRRKSKTSIRKSSNSSAVELLRLEYAKAKKCKPGPVINETLLRKMGYRIRSVIREGEYYKVKKAIDKNNAIVDIRITEKSQVTHEYLRQFVLNEISNLVRLKNQNIVRHICAVETNFNVYLITSGAANGTLEQLIQRSTYLRELLCQRIVASLVNALDYLHYGKSMAHRNIASSNVLLAAQFSPKLSNLELATRVPQGGFVATYCGTVHYSAPEVQRCEVHDPFLADVWSLGALTYEMLVGTVPFHGWKTDLPDKSDLLWMFPPKFPAISTTAKESILQMLQAPRRRPNVKILINMNWTKMSEARRRSTKGTSSYVTNPNTSMSQKGSIRK